MEIKSYINDNLIEKFEDDSGSGGSGYNDGTGNGSGHSSHTGRNKYIGCSGELTPLICIISRGYNNGTGNGGGEANGPMCHRR